MRKGILVLALALAGSAHAAGGPAKIGYIDLQKTIDGTKLGKQAREKLESEKNDKQKQVNDKKTAFDKQYAEYQKQQTVLKPEAKAQREKELQDQYVELQQMFMSLQQDLSKKEAQLFRDILARASPIIENIAKRDGYTVILERNQMVWADSAVDITAEVNKRLDAGEGAPPPKADTPKTDTPKTDTKPGKK